MTTAETNVTDKAAAVAHRARRSHRHAEEGHRPARREQGRKDPEMIARAKGATLAEIMTATDWQAHSVSGFISTPIRSTESRSSP